MKFLNYLFLFLIIFSCRPKKKIDKMEYSNIVIVSDLSSRIKIKPNNDIEKINSLIDYFKNNCVKPGEKSGDKSSIYFSALTEPNFIGIDIDSIKELVPKQMFVNSTGKFSKNGLNHKLLKLKERVKRTYHTIRNPGLDLISILDEKIQNSTVIKADTTITSGSISENIKFHNHLYVFTDGYLEYLGFQQNSQFYFSKPQIERIRDYCRANNVDVKNALKNNSKLGLPPLKGIKNKIINLHVLETHERDKDFVKNIYIHTDGFRDNQILEAVWEKWAMESGFKSFEWKKY